MPQTPPLTQELSDAQWVARALTGSAKVRKDAYSKLVCRHERAVRNLLRQLCQNHAVADELAQEAFLTGWLKLRELRDPPRFAGWIKQIGYREFLHNARRAKLERQYANQLTDHFTAEAETDVRARSTDNLAAMLALCSPIERELMILQFGFEFTQEEIASARQMPIGTVKSHVHRAKQKIRTHLSRVQGQNEQTASDRCCKAE